MQPTIYQWDKGFMREAVEMAITGMTSRERRTHDQIAAACKAVTRKKARKIGAPVGHLPADSLRAHARGVRMTAFLTHLAAFYLGVFIMCAVGMGSSRN